MSPNIERMIALHPQALLLSPFENSGGYGKLEGLGCPCLLYTSIATVLESMPVISRGMSQSKMVRINVPHTTHMRHP